MATVSLERPDAIELVHWGTETRTIVVARQAPPAMKAALQGHVWTKDDFDVHTLIGKTSFAWVYNATCKLCGETVALKCYRKSLQSALNYRQIEREMSVQANLEHPHILKFYGAYEDEQFIYMVQQLATEGDVYKTYLAKRIKLTERQLVRSIVRPLLSALVHIHGHGIIHRDIKPENLFLDGDHTLLLADYGLSIDNALERPVSRVGTLDYMAPEVVSAPRLRAGQNVRAPGDTTPGSYDYTVDLYAVGILAYEFIHGQPPFYVKDRKEKQARILQGQLNFSDAFSKNAQDFIQTATSCHVARRSTAAELLQHPWIVRYCSTQLVDTLAASPGRLSAPVSRRTEESAVPAPTLAAKSRMSVDAQSQKHWTARPAPAQDSIPVPRSTGDFANPRSLSQRLGAMNMGQARLSECATGFENKRSSSGRSKRPEGPQKQPEFSARTSRDQAYRGLQAPAGTQRSTSQYGSAIGTSATPQVDRITT